VARNWRRAPCRGVIEKQTCFATLTTIHDPFLYLQLLSFFSCPSSSISPRFCCSFLSIPVLFTFLVYHRCHLWIIFGARKLLFGKEDLEKVYHARGTLLFSPLCLYASFLFYLVRLDVIHGCICYLLLFNNASLSHTSTSDLGVK
jgi:hypothetical protein